MMFNLVREKVFRNYKEEGLIVKNNVLGRT